MKLSNTLMLKVGIMFIVKQTRSAQSSEKKSWPTKHIFATFYIWYWPWNKWTYESMQYACFCPVLCDTAQPNIHILDSQMWQVLDKGAIKCTNFFFENQI